MAPSLARALLVAVACLLWTQALGQSKAPNLSKEQRQALQAAVTAAKAAAPLGPDGAWQMHLLRASDGSHYVAFSAHPPADLKLEDNMALYVRLEPRAEEGASITPLPRSAVEEWLAGQRSDPLPQRAARVVQIPTGEMPVGGLGATSSRDGSGQNSAVLRLIERQQEKDREEREAKEKARREALEGRAAPVADLLPFEDFDLAAHVVVVPGRAPLIRRAVTAGPGAYDLVVGWAVLDRQNRPTSTGGFRKAITLPAAQTNQLAVGSIIVADAIGARTAIYGADQQTAHPYTLGATEIEPAADQIFTNNERLAAAFQVFNALPSLTRKPDVGIAFRLFRKTPAGEELAATLAPLQYTEETLPPDFDLTLGHPLLAAFTAPLRTLPRGDYRLAIGVTDRIARVSTTAETHFSIVATAATLLAGAPAFTAPFSRARWLQPAVFDPTLDALAPLSTTPALLRLMALARERRFVDLAPDPAVGPQERGMAMLLQAIAAYALGDTARAVSVRLDRTLEAGGPTGAIRYWMGAALALENRDQDALDAWREAGARGWPAALLALPVAEAHVRQGQMEQAGATARQALDGGSNDAGLVLIAAAADLAAGRHQRAVEVLERHLTTAPDDDAARWLMLHAMFAGLVDGTGPAATPPGRARFVEQATRYIDAGGRNRALADEWRGFATSSASAVP